MSVTTTTRMPKTGFPPASKLLSRYEHERAYKQHQQKMQEMRHGLDNSNPKEYPHLAVRMKRLQKEEERQLVVDQENELLVRKMRKIMTRKGRLDNWNHEYEPRNNLHAAYRERQQEQIAVENMGMAKRLEKVGPVYRVSRWEEDYQRHEEILERRAEETKDYEESLTPRGRSKRTAKTRQKPHKASRAAKKPTADDKYEDDFESDEEDSTQKSETKENNRISEGDQKDGSQNGENRRKEAQNDDDSSLPHIKKEEESSSEKAESRRNSKTSPQQSKVSKLPAVNQSKKGEGGTSLADSDAKLLFRVCKQLEKPDDIVIKTLVRRSYNQRMQTKTKFRDLYDLDLVSELRQGLGEPWFPLISALLTENEASDISAVHTALQTGDVSAVVETLSTRSSASLSSLADGYRKEYAISLESEVSEKTADPVRLLLLSLIKGGRADSSDVNEDEAEKDARELYESGEGRWTSDTGKFIRLIQQKNSAQFRATLNMFKQIAGGKDIMVSIKQDCADHPQYVDALSTFINCSKGPQMYFSEKLHGCKKLDDPGFVNILVSRAEADMPGTRKSYKKKYGRELAEDVGSKGPHPTLRVLLELVNRPAPGQARSKPGQPSKKTTNAPGGQPKKTVTRKTEKKDDAASTKPSPLDKPGKRVLAEAKLKREVEERAKSKQAAPKREKTKVDKEASEPVSSDGTVKPAGDFSADGTVKPAGDFSADKDAERLYKAMDGLGTNEEEIMGILPRRSNSQRQSIRQAYSKKYDRDLLEDLKSELSGDFEELILALMMTPVQYDAYCVHDAVRGLGTDEAMLVGVLSTRSSEEIKAVKEQYESAYKSDMKKDTSGDTSNAFKQMLVSLMNGERSETETVDEGLAEELAQKLCKEDKSLYVDDGTLLTLLTTHSRAQIRATFEKYKQIAGHDVYEGIRMAMRGDDEDGYLALAKAADDVIEFYAGRLHRSLTRDVGSDDKMLTRIIVSRSEIDLGVIQSKYKDLYGKSLQESVERECDGDFKKTLLAILGDK